MSLPGLSRVGAAFFGASLATLFVSACAALPPPSPDRGDGGQAKVLVTFVVTAPSSTPTDARLYLASNAGDWKAGDPRFALSKSGQGSWSGSFPLEPGYALEYKITRGSWDSVEKGPGGTEVSNRHFSVPNSGGEARVDIDVGSWRDQTEGAGRLSSVVGTLKIIPDFDLARLGVKRTIRIWLPPDYAMRNRRYPVLYMHDGQNLFDAATSFAGEWKVDESLAAVAARDPGKGLPLAAIVVGIDNGGAQRLNEYSPFKDHYSPSPRGDRYVESLVRDLKPWIDANYRTLADRDHTWIGGSSMGGLISLYAVWAHPETFSRALCMSSAFFFGDHAMLHLIKEKGIAKDLTIYLDVGGKEGDIPSENVGMVDDSKTMYEALLAAGIPPDHVAYVFDQGAPHNEGAWSRRFPSAYAWLAEATSGP